MNKKFFVIFIILILLVASLSIAEARNNNDKPNKNKKFDILLKSRQFEPVAKTKALTKIKGVTETKRILTTAEEIGRPKQKVKVLVQLDRIPNEEEKQILEDNGVKLLNYVPNNAWFASVQSEFLDVLTDLEIVRYVGDVLPEDKVSQQIQKRGVGPWAKNKDNTVNLTVLFFEDISNEEAREIIEKYGDAINEPSISNIWSIRIPENKISKLADEDEVQWIEEILPPPTTFNDGARAAIGVNTVQSSPYNLNGTNIDVGIWDGGHVDATHDDFGSRVTYGDSASVDDHATHVGGTVGGSGLLSASNGGTAYQWKGMAPSVDIISYYWDNNIGDHNGAINTYGIEMSQNSWGYTINEAIYDNCDLYGDYTSEEKEYDQIITGLYGKRINVIFAAGNERNDGDCGINTRGGYSCLGPPSTAKNIITVGAINSDDDSMTTFSSWGPMDDGRIKPDIMAPGCENGGEGYIHSTLPGDTYGGAGWCGTSMAAPVVSGSIALLIQQYRLNYSGSDPWPSTIKALLIQTAKDLSTTGPDYSTGYGRINVKNAVDTIINKNIINSTITSTGQLDTYSLNVPDGKSELKVTLVWDDYPGTPGAAKALVNDIDLWLVSPSGSTYSPYVLDPNNPSNAATTSYDEVNNVEQVYVSSPTAGTWKVKIHGYSIPYSQTYSIVHTDLSSTVTIYNDGGADLSVTSITTPPWASVSPISFTVSSGDSYDIKVTVDETGLSNGTYNDYIKIYSNDPDENPKSIPISLTVSCQDPDGDGICSSSDTCPNNYGPSCNDGCPDTTKPSITIDSPTNQSYNTQSIWVNLSASDSCLDLMWFNNETTNITLSPPYKTEKTFAKGTRTIIAYASDTSGNVDSASVSFTVQIPLNLTINSPTNQTYGSTTVLLNVSVGETTHWINKSVDGETPVNICSDCSSAIYNLTSLSDGNHNVTVYAEDILNNIGSITKTFSVDASVPIIYSYNLANGTYIEGSSSQTFSVTYTELNLDNITLYWKNSTLVSYNAINLTGCSSGSNKVCSQNLNLSSYSNNDQINYYFGVFETGGASTYLLLPGNKPYTVIVDKESPTITLSSPANNSINKPGTIIDLSINDNGIIETVLYSVSNATNQTINSPYEIDTFSWTNGTYEIIIYAIDTVGNVNDYTSFTIIIDAIAPTSSVNALPLYSNSLSFNVSWSGNDSSGIASYDIEFSDNNGVWTIWKDDITDTSAIYSGADGHTYRFISKAKDNVGNIETKSTPDTNTTVDITKPSITLISPSNNSIQEIGTIINLSITDAIPLSFVWYSNGTANTTINSPYDIDTSTWLKAEYTITVYVNDSVNNLNSEVYKFILDNRPSITTTPDTSTLEDELYNYDINATDADGDTLTYSLTTNPTGMIINSSGGLINWTPDNSQVGSHVVTIEVTDGNLSTNQSFTLTVINVNDAPNVTTPLPDVKFEEDTYNDTINLSRYFSDVDNTTLNYDYKVNNTNVYVTIFLDNTIKINATLNWNGIANTTIIADDGEYNINGSMLVNITAVNDPPILALISDVTVNESDLVYINANAVDVDGDNLIFYYGSPLNSSGQWKTNYQSFGVYNVLVTVSDYEYNDSQTVTITVLEVEDDDNDGINDTLDKLLGNSSDINSSTTTPVVEVGGDNNLSKQFSGMKNVSIKDNNSIMVEFEFNFSQSMLSLPNITLEKENNTAEQGVTLIKGISLPAGITKTVYVNNKNNLTSLCIKDAEISSITQISSLCNGADEYGIECPGTANSNKYNCSYSDSTNTTFKVTGLDHTGIQQQTYCGDGTCNGNEDCSSCSSDCGACPSGDTGDGAGGGGGGGGGGGTASRNPYEASRFFAILTETYYPLMAVYSPNISINRLSFNVNKRLYGVRVNIKVLSETATPVKISGDVYQYLELSTENLNDSDLSEPVEIKFKVNKKWLNQKDVNKEDVALYRYKEKWNKLGIEIEREDNSTVFYISKTPGFSVFAIAATEEAREVTELVVKEEEKIEEEIEEAPAIIEIEGGEVIEEEGGFFVITGRAIGGAYKEKPLIMALLTMFILLIVVLFIYAHIKDLKHWPFHFKHKKKRWIIPIIVFIVLFLLFVYFVNSIGKYDDFAKCLSDKGVVMYISEDCKPCEEQKKMFGYSAKYLIYNDCKNITVCEDIGIEGFPSWIINDKIIRGKQTLTKLSELGGCKI